MPRTALGPTRGVMTARVRPVGLGQTRHTGRAPTRGASEACLNAHVGPGHLGVHPSCPRPTGYVPQRQRRAVRLAVPLARPSTAPSAGLSTAGPELQSWFHSPGRLPRQVPGCRRRGPSCNRGPIRPAVDRVKCRAVGGEARAAIVVPFARPSTAPSAGLSTAGPELQSWSHPPGRRPRRCRAVDGGGRAAIVAPGRCGSARGMFGRTPGRPQRTDK